MWLVCSGYRSILLLQNGQALSLYCCFYKNNVCLLVENDGNVYQGVRQGIPRFRKEPPILISSLVFVWDILPRSYFKNNFYDKKHFLPKWRDRKLNRRGTKELHKTKILLENLLNLTTALINIYIFLHLLCFRSTWTK